MSIGIVDNQALLLINSGGKKITGAYASGATSIAPITTTVFEFTASFDTGNFFLLIDLLFLNLDCIILMPIFIGHKMV